MLPTMNRSRLVTLATEYSDQREEETTPEETVEFVIPEDFATLDDEALRALHADAVQHFDAIYGDGQSLSEDDLEALSTLTEGIEALQGEMGARAEAAAARAEKAAELAAKVRTNAIEDEAESEDEDGDGAAPAEDSAAEENGEEDAEEAQEAPADLEAVAASASTPKRREVRVNLSRVNSRHIRREESRDAAGAKRMQDIVFASGEGTGYAAGQGLDWNDVGKIVDKRLNAFNHTQYQHAARAGKHLRQQFGVASIARPIPADLRIESTDLSHVTEVLERARNEKRLQGGSLVASGGWCAPSETLYDLLELETRDGLVSIPEVGVARGGLQRTLGPDFADLFENITGFDYTEEDDIDGDYDGEGGGAKPCYHVECADFEEFRLGIVGLCLTAGLLQQRGYPELIARTVRGALVAHDHRIAAKKLDAMVSGSTAITMPAAQQGATAPLLTAIEQQVEAMRTRGRLSRTASLEGVFPTWVRGAIRSDLSRRNGYSSPFDVTDAQIDAWFRLRGVAPQFVYNLQDIGTGSSDVTWPETAKFLLYPAGGWIAGVADVITLDTLYDSTLLGTNDYTALFTEDGLAVIKMTHDSRVVTVPICPDGSTGAQVPFDCDGTTLVPDTGDGNGDGDGGEDGGENGVEDGGVE